MTLAEQINCEKDVPKAREVIFSTNSRLVYVTMVILFCDLVSFSDS